MGCYTSINTPFFLIIFQRQSGNYNPQGFAPEILNKSFPHISWVVFLIFTFIYFKTFIHFKHLKFQVILKSIYISNIFAINYVCIFLPLSDYLEHTWISLRLQHFKDFICISILKILTFPKSSTSFIILYHSKNFILIFNNKIITTFWLESYQIDFLSKHLLRPKYCLCSLIDIPWTFRWVNTGHSSGRFSLVHKNLCYFYFFFQKRN